LLPITLEKEKLLETARVSRANVLGIEDEACWLFRKIISRSDQSVILRARYTCEAESEIKELQSQRILTQITNKQIEVVSQICPLAEAEKSSFVFFTKYFER
jgi:hypothetical protein